MTSKGDYLYTTCYICGCSGSNNYSKYIAKCSTCENLEHQYCMVNQLREVPEDWRCDECQPSKKPKEISKVPHMESKVKFIPDDQAALLASGAKVSCRRTSTACKQIRGGMPSTPRKSQWFRPKEEPISGKFCPKPVYSGKGSSPSKKIKPYGVSSIKQEVHGRDLTIVPEGVIIDSERSQTILEAGQHAQKAPWKGSFNIQDTNFSVCVGVKAHSWRKWMNDKAYETSKRMPKIVRLKFKPCESIWPKVFKLQPPETTDIALYFDPNEDYRPWIIYSTNLSWLSPAEQVRALSRFQVKKELLYSFRENGFQRSGHGVLHLQCLLADFFFKEVVASSATGQEWLAVFVGSVLPFQVAF